MKANELRIGNLVDLYGKIATIQSADFSTGIAIKKGNPIPLTEEWLLKFGIDPKDPVLFKRGALTYYAIPVGEYANSGHILICTHGVAPMDKIPCEHVHTLQNFYRIHKGEELTIKE